MEHIPIRRNHLYSLSSVNTFLDLAQVVMEKLCWISLCSYAIIWVSLWGLNTDVACKSHLSKQAVEKASAVAVAGITRTSCWNSCAAGHGRLAGAKSAYIFHGTVFFINSSIPSTLVLHNFRCIIEVLCLCSTSDKFTLLLNAFRLKDSAQPRWSRHSEGDAYTGSQWFLESDYFFFFAFCKAC